MAFQALSQLRAEAQQRCNQENKTLVATADWNRYVNEGIGELYDIVIAANPHYYVSQSAFTLSASNAFDMTTLSGTFYKMRGLDYLPSANYPRTVHPLNFAERNRYLPTQNFAGNYNLWWTPAPPKLVNDTDTLDFILDAWAEYPILHAAIIAAIKEDNHETAADLAESKAAIATRVKSAAPNRDGEPQQAAELTSHWNVGDSGRRYMMEGSSLIILGSNYDPWVS